MEEENELIVNDDVPETSEEEIETNTSEEVESTTEEVVKPSEEDIEKLVEERASKIVEETIKDRLARDRDVRERKAAPMMAKYRQLENIMKTALGAESLDDVLTKSRNFYKEQGIDIPEENAMSNLTDRQIMVLAKDDAERIIAAGDEEMEEEANRIAAIPPEKRTVVENTIFNEVCKELSNRKDIKSMKEKGYDTKILEDKDFQEFRWQFAVNKPASEIYEMYQVIKGTKPVQPNSPGSAKTNNSDNEIKDFYTPEEARKFTEEDLDNPKLMAALDRSMLQWGKNK